MNRDDSGTGDGESAGAAVRGAASTGERYLSRFGDQGGVGRIAAVGGAVSVLQGLRELRRGNRTGGLARVGLGALLVGVAVAQRRWSGDRGATTDVDQADVVGFSSEVEAAVDPEGDETADEATPETSEEEVAAVGDTTVDVGEVDEPDRESSSDVDRDDVDQSDVVETGVDAAAREEAQGDEASAEETPAEPDEAAASAGAGADSGEGAATGSPEAEPTEVESSGTESHERLGAAAFNEHTGQLPVPQRAFDLNVLALGSEVFWGVRESDGAVVVSQLFDPIQDGAGMRYVASSEVDDERNLKVPDAVLNHWDEVAGGGTAVVSGDELVFATTDDLRADSQLLVVPEQWVGELLGDEE